MRRLLTALLVLGAALGLAAPASAKGPQEAVFDGEGLAGPIDLRQSLDDETFWSMTDDLGYFAVVGNGHEGSAAPAGELGPLLTLTWQGPASETEDFDVTVELYPWAADGGRIHVPAGQRSILEAPTVDSWYELPARVLPVLRRAGLPSRAALVAASAPDTTSVSVEAPAASLVADEASGTPWALLLGSISVGAVVAGGLVVLLRRGRRSDARSTVAPA